MPKPKLEPIRRRVTPAPPEPEALGPLPTSTLLPLPGIGPEDVVVDGEGRLLCGLEGGAIVRVDPMTGSTEVVANTGGRPLGLDVQSDGRLLVCDAHRGLLRVDLASGEIETLVREVDGVPLRFCSNATTDEAGTIWFTESTSRFDFEDYLGALLEQRPSGRLFRRDPDGTVTVVLGDLHFANGVALAPDRQSVLYIETGNYSLSRLWLNGPRTGTTDVLLRNLGGFPDNMSKFADGRAWISIINPRSSALDVLANWPGWIRRFVWWLPDIVQPARATTVWAIAVDADGRVIETVHGDHPRFHSATGSVEYRRVLYMASLEMSELCALELNS